MDFFAELYADSDSESEEFLGFDLPDLEDSGDVFDEEEVSLFTFLFCKLDKNK